MTFLEVWVGYAFVGVLVFSFMFTWAVRTGQFSGLDRARHLALRAAEPIEDSEGTSPHPSRLDRYTWLGLALVTTGLLGYTLWVAMRAG